MDATESLSVLLINDYPDVAGGAEEQMFRERKMLRESGHKANAIGFDQPDGGRKSVADYVLDEPSSRSVRVTQKVTIQPSIYREIREILRSEKPDIVHIHKNIKYPATVLLACRDYPTVKTHHDFTTVCPSGWAAYQDTWEICPGGPGLKCVQHNCKSATEMAGFYVPQYTVKKWCQRQYVDIHLAPSKRLTSYLNDFGLNTKTLPYPASKKFSDRATTEPGEKKFVFAGRLTEEKGVQILLKAIHNVKIERNRHITLDIAGKGPYGEELSSLVTELGLENNVTFQGHVEHEKLSSLFANARAVVVPSIWMENFPNVVIEALSMGRPVVGSDRGGIPELLGSGERGWVYDAIDPMALADALVEALDNPDMASRKGEAGLRYIDDYLDPDRIKNQYMYTFNKIL